MEISQCCILTRGFCYCFSNYFGTINRPFPSEAHILYSVVGKNLLLMLDILFSSDFYFSALVNILSDIESLYLILLSLIFYYLYFSSLSLSLVSTSSSPKSRVFIGFLFQLFVYVIGHFSELKKIFVVAVCCYFSLLLVEQCCLCFIDAVSSITLKIVLIFSS